MGKKKKKKGCKACVGLSQAWNIHIYLCKLKCFWAAVRICAGTLSSLYTTDSLNTISVLTSEKQFECS